MSDFRAFNRGEEIEARSRAEAEEWLAQRADPDPWWAWPVVAGVISVWVCALVLAGWNFWAWVTG